MRKYFFLLIFCFLSAQANENLAQAYKWYKLNNFKAALKELNKVKMNFKTQGSKEYLAALCYSRLEEFDLANIHFRRSFKLDFKPKDLHYEYGQSLYGASELEKALGAFKSSYETKYKAAESLYYVGHLQQILERYDEAKTTYIKLIKHPDATRNLKQIARYQLSETMLLLGERSKNPRKIVRKYVLPQYGVAIRVDPKSKLSWEIRAREIQVRRRYKLDPNMLENGRLIPAKRYSIFAAQKISFDTNVIQQSEIATQQTPTKKESYVFDTQLFGNYRLVFQKRFQVIPSLFFSNSMYAERDISDIYENDYYLISPALNNLYEHKLFDAPAALALDFKYSYLAKDYEGIKDKKSYQKDLVFGLSEKFRLVDLGDTIIKYAQKISTGYTPVLDSKTTSFYFSQYYGFDNGTLLISALSFDYLRYDLSSAEDTDTTTLTFNYIVPDLFRSYSLSFLVNYAMIDTLENKETRGVEKVITLNPKFTKSITRNFRFSVGYTLTNKTSKDEDDYSYKKHLWSTEFKYIF